MEDEVVDIQNVFVDAWNDFLAAIPGIILALIIFLIGLFIARWIAKLFGQKILQRMDDPLMARFLTNTLRILLIIGVALLALNAMGLGGIAAGIFGAAGVGAVVLGFAFQDIGENFISGVVLAFNRPFEVEDTIEVENYFGKVKGLNLRYTHIKTFDGKDVYVPNGDVMNNVVVNYTADGFLRLEFVVGIAYEDDIDGAIRVVDELVAEYPEIINTDAHPSFACVDELAASTVNIKVRFWIETTEFRRAALESRGAFIRATKERLDEHGFGLPADITELKMYGPEESIPLRIVGDERPRSRQAA